MNDVAIRVEGLSKRYRIGSPQERYKTLGDALVGAVQAPYRLGKSLASGARKSRHPTIWALKDVSFDVKQGEVIGIIGRNGAGKSTLLKILSRITEPTDGYAEIRGRVGSLLEVGTGFHPELTGRENIYLNGAILGMRRTEIARNFDDIVGFAEVPKFIDTPVKHYSSGMYLRLAFSVAAHLEPEILLVDEVLAVGDAAFQKKCLGKMGDVASEGRTVFLVSHNMAAIKSLCPVTLLLKDGEMSYWGPTERALSRYSAREETDMTDLARLADRGGQGPIRFAGIEVLDEFGERLDVVQSGQGVLFEVRYTNTNGHYPTAGLALRIYFTTATGERLFMCSTQFSQKAPARLPASGRVRCLIEKLPLMPGQYYLDLVCKADKKVLDYVWSAKALTVIEGDFFGDGRLPPPSDGPILVDNAWELVE